MKLSGWITEEIKKARKRFENKKVPYRPVKGFTLKEKSVEEMAKKRQIPGSCLRSRQGKHRMI